MDQPVHRDVTASGVRLRVLEVGAGAPVLLLHGLFLSRKSWDGVLASLCTNFRVIAPDLPGFGDSEKPPSSRYPYGIEAFAEAICDLYGGLDIGRAAVVGHALGGAIALTLAARHPELVSRLVLVDALCYPTRLDLPRRIATLPFIGNFVFKQLWSRGTFRAMYRDTMVSTHAQIETERIDEYYEAFNTPAARGSALATLRATIDTRPVVADTARIAAPTLVVWGRMDQLYPAALGQRLARQIRGAGFKLMDTGHAPQEEQPEELARIVADFLRAP